MLDLALIIPCYNEAKRIKPTFQAWFDYFLHAPSLQGKQLAIILVNDGSLDETASVLAQLQQESTERVRIEVVSYGENVGKGGAISRGVQAVDARIYGFTDADLSYAPSFTSDFLSALEQGADAAIGQREEKNSTYGKKRMFISRSLKSFVHRLLGISFPDTQCGFKFFTRKIAREVIPHIQNQRFSFDVELVTLLESKKYSIRAIPIALSHNTDSTITWKDGVRYLLDVVAISDRLKQKPSRSFFWSLFLVASLLTLVMFGWIMVRGYFFSDDFTWLWHAQKIDGSLLRILSFRMSSFYSPVLNAFYSIMYGIFGTHPAPYFFFGLVVHVLVSSSSAILAWQLSKSRLIAFGTLVLMSLAGGAYEPILWVGANMHSVVALFIVLSLIFYIKFLHQKKNIFLVFSFLSFILALGTKEVAIVTIALLLGVFVFEWRQKRSIPKTIAHGLYGALVLVATGLYAYQQYIWQMGSVWVQSGVWSFNIFALVRTPLILFDIFFPTTLLQPWLTETSAVVLWIVALCFFLFLMIRFARVPLLWLGLFWIIVCISPTIFFTPEYWWQPLASRYTYFARVGMVFFLMSILQRMITKNTARFIVSAFMWIVAIVSLAQVYSMVHITLNDYEYVYTSGRTLAAAMETLKQTQPSRIVVRWDHPFQNNMAHIVGAGSVIAHLPEERFFFLQKDEKFELKQGEVLLYWNAPKKMYEITQENLLK